VEMNDDVNDDVSDEINISILEINDELKING
jgi:hypothetical protein